MGASIMMTLILFMEIKEITLHAKLLVITNEELGYKTLVFEDLEYKDPDFKYITCTIFPNWNQNPIKLGDEGFLQVKFISAGIDKWFDGKDFIPYKYTNIQFLKFIKNEKQNIELILD